MSAEKLPWHHGLFNPTQTTARPSYFCWVDIVRGLAAFSVLIWHYQHFYYLQPGVNPIVADRSIQPFYYALSFFYKYGASAVSLFWVISGFVLSAAYLKPEIVSGREFFVNRFARLYPLHFLTLLLVAGLQKMSFLTTGQFQIYPYNDLYHFVMNIFMASDWGFQKGNSFNWPIWSVSVEVAIYAVFFLYRRRLANRGLSAAVFSLGVFMLMVLLRVPSDFCFCGLYFFAGCTVYMIVNGLKDFSGALLLTGIAGVVASIFIGYRLPGWICSDKQLLIMLPSIVMAAGSLDMLEKKIGPRFRIVGDLTYPIYLWHIPAQIAIILVLQHRGIGREIVSTKSFFLGFVVLVVCISYFSFRYFELPVKSLIRRKMKPATPALRQVPA